MFSMILLSVYRHPGPAFEWLPPILQGALDFSGLRALRMLSGHAGLLTEVSNGLKSTAERLERIK